MLDAKMLSLNEAIMQTKKEQVREEAERLVEEHAHGKLEELLKHSGEEK
jgi:putative GTP pyrophosphokinase